jgi:formylglycine-generating enzyme required for sulfatase activity
MASEAIPAPPRSFVTLGGDCGDTPPSVEGHLGRYQILGELGRGGMGRVLRALDPEIGREVAVKVLLRPHDPNPEALARFIHEARITGQLEHPNIVPVYDVGVSDEGLVYYVMRRVAGQSLDAVIASAQEGWSLHRLLTAFVSVCAAVSFAHSRGVVHQDLKPQNIILGAFDEVLVLDWGLATLLRAGLDLPEVTLSSGGLGGTPGYIAPEAIRAPLARPTPWMDQWSLGATLYTLLTGLPPYEGATARAVLDATLAGPPTDPRLRSPARVVPNELAELCQRVMDPAPDRRLPDVAALGAEVRAYLEGSQRRARALVWVAEADALAPKIHAQREEAARLAAAAEAELVGVRGLDPIEKKRGAWALQDEAAAAARAADLDQVVWEERLQGALQLTPGLHEAHVRLALHHRQSLEAAEARRDLGAAARAEWLLRQHDRGHHRRWLAGTGALTLCTDPPGVTAQLHRLVLVDRQLRPDPGEALGETPILQRPVAPGSYLVVLTRPGHTTVRYPIQIPRAGRWDGVPPGENAPLPIRLPKTETLGPDDLLVPAGWFWAGGDDEAPDSLSLRRVWVDSFIARRHPVTNGEFLAWINGLIHAGHAEVAERYVPRDVQRPTTPTEGAPLFKRTDAEFFGPPGDVDPARWARLPVTGVDLTSARAFAEAQGWRLPNELEREKLARGVDGRRFPWGDHHDPALSCVVLSQSLPQPVPVGSFPLDCSVYGASGLAGNVRDLCDNEWTEQGPAQDGERLTHVPAALDVPFVSARGGAWSSTAVLARSAARLADAPSTRYAVRGLRLFRDL